MEELIKKKNNSLKIIICIVIAILLLVGGFFLYKSLSKDTNTERDNNQQEKLSPILYEVTKEGSTNKMYLFGSIHVTSKGDLELLPDYVLNAYNNSHYLACEFDSVKVLSNQEYMLDEAMKLLYQDGTTIKDHLSEETYNKLISFLNEKKSYVNAYEYYKPVFFISLLTNLLTNDAKLGGGSVDEYFEDKAYNDNKTILEVESYDYQLNLLDGFSDELYDLMILDNIQNYEENVKGLINLYNAWKSGNALDLIKYGSDEIEEDNSYTEKQINEIKEFNNKLINVRNKNMVDKAIEYFNNNQDVFFMVGAFHIIGDDGIASILQANGFNVKKVQD